MRRPVVLVTALAALLGVALPKRAAAQNAQCAQFPTLNNARQSCDAAVDLTSDYTPIAGLMISGGNPVLGSDAGGGLGHFSFVLRGNAVNLSVPDLGNVSANGTVPQSSKVFAPAPLLEASVGVFPGVNGGMFALDLLGAAQLVPNEKIVSDIRVDPDAPRLGPVSLGIGFGARVSLLAGVAVSVMRRSIPTTGYGNLATGDDVAADVSLHAWNVRLAANKRLSVLSLGAGVGWSKYSGDATASFQVAGAAPGTVIAGTVDVPLSATRSMLFADIGLDLNFFKIMGELGYQTGKDQQLGTTFTGFDDTKGTTFYSVGLRMGI